MEGLMACAQGGKNSSRLVEAGFGYGFATMQNPSWTLDQVLLATKGRLLCGNVHAGFRSISTDSRTLKPGDLFVAISGENYEGACFIDDALKNGASGVVVNKMPDQKIPIPVILVEDCLKALGDLAAYRRTLIKGLEVLAVTGSSGKTTVKEMTAGILSRCGNVIKTIGNFNNLIGLPLSLLPVNYRHDYAVLEMGMNTSGEIARLTEIADPDVACINNIGTAHMEGLGSIANIAKAKGELFESCRASTILVVNQDDPKVMKLVKNATATVISFGKHKKSFIRATHIYKNGEKGVSYTLHIGPYSIRVKLKVLGEHNVINSLAAAAMAYSMGAGLTQIILGLESFKSESSRLNIVDLSCGLKVVNDSYNANPASMKAALATVKGIRKREKIVAVLGDMLELGDFSVKAHEQVGKYVAQNGFDYLFVVGDYAGNIVAAARKAGMEKGSVKKFESKQEIVKCLTKLWNKKKLCAGDLVLLKGSRGMKMEAVLMGLEKAKLVKAQ